MSRSKTISLNASQKQAVETTEGRLLILAGAGSGKTRVIVQRIAYLIQEKEVPPEAILGMTFTNKAALEMRERIAALIGKPLAKKVTLSTFHSFCMQVLRRYITKLGYTQKFSLYDEKDIDRVLGQLARDLLGHTGPLPSLAPSKAAILEASSKEEYVFSDPFSKELHEKLGSTLRSYNAVSFDHLIQLTLQLFREHPEVLKAYQERYRYFMIDEYQDTNTPQSRLTELLASDSNNLCVVGDDDQSIYGWRGAVVDHILHFKANQVVRLEENYRSSPIILEAANAIIAKNEKRHGKRLFTSKTTGHPIEVFHGINEAEEAEGLVQRILELKQEKGFKWKEIAVLYRSNALSRSVETALMNASWNQDGQWVRGIPYAVFGGLEFAERAEIKDLFAYLRAINNPLDEEALLRILNVPRRGISNTFLETLTKQNRQEKIPLWKLLKRIADNPALYPSNPKGTKGITSFCEILEEAQSRFEDKLGSTLSWLIERIDYKKAIEEEVKSEKMRLFKWENVQECVNSLTEYEQKEPSPSLEEFVASTILIRSQIPSKSKQTGQDKVQLMTFHSAKGLEFPACFLIGLEDHILPHEKSIGVTGIEEERRLFYVALTRAQTYLTLSMARSRLKAGRPFTTTPSRFVFDIPRKLIKPTPCKR